MWSRKDEVMPKWSTPKSGLRWSAYSMLAASACTFLSSPTAKLDVRGIAEKKIIVALPKLSPALAALEDVYKTWPIETKKVRSPSSEVNLSAGTSAVDLIGLFRPSQDIQEEKLRTWLAAIPLGGRIVVQNMASQPIQAQHTPKVVSLQGLTLKSQPLSVQVAQADIAVRPAPIQLNAPTSRFLREVRADELRQPTVAERAEKLVQRELAAAPANPQSKMLGGILVAAPAPPTKYNPADNPSSPGPVPAKPNFLPNPNPQPSRAGISWAQPQPSNSSRATLSGRIELGGGLAITNVQQRIVISRELEGLAIEKAQVWLEDGRFEIATKSLRGRLVGRLLDGKGTVLGSGEIRLTSLSPANDSDRIENLKMVISPAVNGAQVEIVSAYSHAGETQLVAQSQVQLVGPASQLVPDKEHRYFREDSLKPGSSYIVRAVAENHWGTLVVGLSGQPVRAELFPNRLIEALINLTVGEKRNLGENFGVIWGRITRDGKPVPNARVELAGEHRLSANYFNSMLLPDRFADSTGENGTFAFVGVTPGIQSVRVVYQGESYPAQIVPTERGHVSYIDFDLGSSEGIPLDVIDPFDTGREVNGVIRWAGDESSEIEIQGRGQLRQPSGLGLFTLELDPGELYELTRYTMPRRTRRLTLPTVRRDWIVSLAARKRVNQDSGVGIAVGYNFDENFTVSIDGVEDESSTPEVVYFDSRGQALFTDEGIPGGGFAIFNIPPGLRTITLSVAGSAQAQTRVIVATPEAVSVVLP